MQGDAQVRLDLGTTEVCLQSLPEALFVILQQVRELSQLFLAEGNGPGLSRLERLLQLGIYL